MKRIDLSYIEIDREALKNTKKTCASILHDTSDKFEEHMWKLLFRLLYKECKIFAVICLVELFLVFYIMNYIKEVNVFYILYFIQMVLLGLFALIELFKNQRLHLQELQYPTKIGGTRLFLYKLVIISSLETLILCITILKGFMSYDLSFPILLSITIVPCYLINGLSLQIAARFTSLRITLLCYFGIGMLYAILLTSVQIPNFQLQMIFVTLFISFIFYVYSCKCIQTLMQTEGGDESWD